MYLSGFKPDRPEEVDSIHNYYEALVLDEIMHTTQPKDPNYLADVACVALNHLPPRYIRYDVDMSFFLSPTELQEITYKVKDAVKMAIDHVDHQRGKMPRDNHSDESQSDEGNA